MTLGVSDERRKKKTWHRHLSCHVGLQQPGLNTHAYINIVDIVENFSEMTNLRLVVDLKVVDLRLLVDLRVVGIGSSGDGWRDESTSDGGLDAESEEQAAKRRTKDKGPWDYGQGLSEDDRKVKDRVIRGGLFVDLKVVGIGSSGGEGKDEFEQKCTYALNCQRITQWRRW